MASRYGSLRAKNIQLDTGLIHIFRSKITKTINMATRIEPEFNVGSPEINVGSAPDAPSSTGKTFSTPDSTTEAEKNLLPGPSPLQSGINSAKCAAWTGLILSVCVLCFAIAATGLSGYVAKEVNGAVTQRAPVHGPGSTGTWEKITPVSDSPPPRLAHAATTAGSPNKRLFIHGGLRGSTTDVYDDLWMYDEGGNEWTRLDADIAAADKPAARLHHSLIEAGAGSNVLILFGGFNNFQNQPGHKAYSDMWEFSLTTRKWKKIEIPESSPQPTARGAHDCVWLKKKMYCFGGFEIIAATGHKQEMWRFDFYGSKSWVNVTAAHVTDTTWPDGRIGFSLSALDDSRAHIYGGGCVGDDSQSGQCADDWIFNADTETFSELVTNTNKPLARRATHGDISAYGLVFLYGGVHVSAGPTMALYDDLWVLDPSAAKWYQLFPNYGRSDTNSPGKRFGHSVSRLGDRMVVFGGREGTGVHPGSNSLFEYTMPRPY